MARDLWVFSSSPFQSGCARLRLLNRIHGVHAHDHVGVVDFIGQFLQILVAGFDPVQCEQWQGTCWLPMKRRSWKWMPS